VSRDHLVEDVKRALTNPFQVADRLGLKPRRSARGVTISCPVRAEKTPSCSVTPGQDGTLRVRCFGCDWTGDVLHLIAAAHQLDPKTDFREVLATACELAGMHEEASAARDGKPPPERERTPAPAPEPERDYPPIGEVQALWATARPLLEDEPAAVCLLGRRIPPVVVTELDAVRALLPETHPTRVPEWARYRGRKSVSQAWNRSGHRIIVPVYDADGVFRSVRAWLVTGEPNVPKRVPPSGHKASGLVLANARAVKMLRGEASPSRVVIVEGEPDTLARCVTNPEEVIIGILSGSWHDGFASRIPYGSEVVVRTHVDHAGERYADKVLASVRKRARVRRLQHGDAA
jgi:hypothetical protein